MNRRQHTLTLNTSKALIIYSILLFFGIHLKGFATIPQKPDPSSDLHVSQTWNSYPQWGQFRTKHLTFIFAKELTGTARFLADYQDRIDTFFEALARHFPDMEDPIDVFVDHRLPTHNGSAAVLPSPRITLYLTPPEFSEQLGKSRTYLYETLVHELAHMAHFSVKSPFYKTLSDVFGEIVNPAGITPRWILEGFAVWVETIATSVGRGRNTFVQGELEYLARTWPSLSDMTGFPKAYPRGNIHYFYGALFFEYLSRTYGVDKVYTYIHRTGHIVPPFYDVPFEEIFGKSLSEVWEDTRAYYTNTTRSPKDLSATIAGETITPDLKEAVFRGDVALSASGMEAYYWESHPYDGHRLIHQNLIPPYEQRIVEHLTPPQFLNSSLTACEDRVYGLWHEVSQTGEVPRLMAWSLPDLQRHDTGVELGPYGKLVDIACAPRDGKPAPGKPALYLLMFYDMGYNLLAYQDARLIQLWHLPYQREGAFPVQLIDHPKALHVLMINPQTYQNEIWVGDTAPIRYALTWTARRKIQRLTYESASKRFWGITDATFGRNLIAVNEDFEVLGERDLRAALPLEAFALPGKRLLLREVQTQGEALSILPAPTDIQASHHAFDPHREVRVAHPDPTPMPEFEHTPFSHAPVSALDTGLSPEDYSLRPYLLPRYWRPLLSFTALKNPTFGLITSSSDPTGSFSYVAQSLFEVNPFAFTTSGIARWSTTLSHHGPIIELSVSPSGKGPEFLDVEPTVGWSAETQLNASFSFFAAAIYQPGWNVSGGYKHRFSFPLQLKFTHTWGSVLYPFGVRATAELELIPGTLTSFQGMRVVNAPSSPAFRNTWHMDIKPALKLTYTTPLLTNTSGVFQSLLYVIHDWTAGDLGPIELDLFRARPYASLTSSNNFPFQSSFSFISHHILIHKFRPFVLLSQLDKGILFLPLFAKEVWLEGVFDTGFLPTAETFFGSFGAQLIATFDIFFHQSTRLELAVYYPWVNQPNFNNPSFRASFVVPFPF